MNLTYKVKALTKELAIEKAIEKYGVKKTQIIEIKELTKPVSFLGFFKKDGEFEIHTDESENGTQHETEEEKVDVKKVVVEKTTELLEKMGLILEINVLEARDHYVLINLSGEDNGIIIGKKGKTLNSFEYLLNSLCKGVKVEVDVEGFKAKRAETLRDLARKMSEKAINTNKTVRLNPMPPRERKIIHEIVNKYKELDTFSEGRDPKRYIVIKRKKTV
ncbi:MAG: KH domain-containing protein [Psychrilyobacter sp.]|nr:KH domain-containing protein [Psychrilyobacter sp.]